VPCPLGFGEQAECVRCHALIPLTSEQRERREHQRKLDADRRQRDELWQLALGSRAHFYHQPTLLAGLSYVAPFVAAIGGYFFGYRDNEYGRAGLAWLLGIGAIHFMTSSLLLRRKPLVLRELLSAQKGDVPGQPLGIDPDGAAVLLGIVKLIGHEGMSLRRLECVDRITG
jgi:hypothetical protein